MNAQPDHPYLAEAVRRAASPQTEAECRERIAQAGQRAFLSVVKTASELTSVGLPEGKTVADALARATARKEFLWRQDMDEDEKIDHLVKFCTSLYRGDESAGKLLASAAIWES